MDQNRSTILQQNDISYSFNGAGAINYSTTCGCTRGETETIDKEHDGN